MFNTVFAMWSRWWDASKYQKGEIEGAILAFSVTIFAIFWSLWTLVVKKKSSPPLPPGPRGLPIVGYLPFLGTDIHRKFTELAELYGPIFKLRLGNRLYVVLNSSSVVKEVVRDHDTTFATHDPTIAQLALTYGGNDIVFNTCGPTWLKLRRLLVREMQAKPSLDACYDLRRREMMKIIKDVYSNKIGTPINFGELACVTVLNSLTSMVWGGTLESDEKGTNYNNVAREFGKMVKEVMVLLGKPNVSDTFPMLAWFDIQGIAKGVSKLTIWCDEIFNSAIKQRTKLKVGKNEQKDFLQHLMDLMELEDAAKAISLTELKALLMDVVVGGMDSTSTKMEWTMAELLSFPEQMKKVIEELNEVVGLNNMVEEFHLPKLEYLDAVVKEVFHLHPPIPLVPRSPTQTTTVGRYTIPKGSKILLNIYAIHRDPRLWDNPLKFSLRGS